MNINSWSGRKKVWVLFGVILAIIGIVVTIFLVQRQQELRSRAEKATTLTFSPPNQVVQSGDNANLDVVIDPGINQVNYVQFVAKFDSDIFDATTATFTVDNSSVLKIISDTQTSSNTITVTLGVGGDPTKVLQAAQKLGNLSLKVRDGAPAAQTEVSFDTKTQVRSIGSTDAFNENVLSSTTPATITIGGVCKPNVATCSWDPANGASSYHYTIFEKLPGSDTEANIQEGDTSLTTIEFPSVPGNTYRCEVISSNVCGEGSPAEGTSTCPVPSATPTPTPSLTPTESPTPTPISAISPTITVTPPVTSTSTPTPTTPQTVTNTPTPTTAINSTSTPTPVPTVVVVVTSTTGTTQIATVPTTAAQSGAVSSTGEVTPSLAPTGNPLVFGGIIGGILFILGGLALLLL